MFRIFLVQELNILYIYSRLSLLFDTQSGFMKGKMPLNKHYIKMVHDTNFLASFSRKHIKKWNSVFKYPFITFCCSAHSTVTKTDWTRPVFFLSSLKREGFLTALKALYLISYLFLCQRLCLIYKIRTYVINIFPYMIL